MRTDLAEQKLTSSAIASLAAATDNISAKVDATEVRLSAQLATLPRKSDLRNYYVQSLAIGFAFLVLVVGGILGGLDWIKVH